jgi:hypothetical protein
VSMSATRSTWARTSFGPGWAKIVRIAAATISAWSLLTLASTLRMKCTRQRCQLAPCITVAMALTRPLWASLIVSCTPARPRSRRSRRNSVQNVSVSLSPLAQPRTSLLPSALTPVAITTAWDTTRPLRRTLQ